MEMIPVSSSNILAIGYDPDSATLTIEFKDGSEYEYYDVPHHEFDNFLVADSKGKYGNRNIYKKYSQQKIR
ncbi:MAG: KTSC domain-containing protein [Rhizobiales bacterium]|nr:KTSC domain-containing protein [Hyphomicrobiales bacterium]